MKCKRCNRIITAQLSKQLGYGPTCWKKVQKQIQIPEKREEQIYLTESQFDNLENYVESYIKPKTSIFATTKKIFNKIWAIKDNSSNYYRKFEIRALNHLIATPI